VPARDNADERTVGYLILNLAVPSHEHPSTRGHIVAANAAGRQIGIKIARIVLADGPPSFPRYVFHFPRYRRDDLLAGIIGEAIYYAVDLTCGPFSDPDDPFTVFPIPLGLLRTPQSLTPRALIEVEEARPPLLKTLDFPHKSLSSVTGFVAFDVAASWRAVPALLRDNALHNAARFLKDSQHNFYVYPGDYGEVLHNEEKQHFTTGWEKSKAEAALLAAFKCVEAIVGTLPSDDERLRRKLVSLGFNPDEHFGLHGDLPMFSYLKLMEAARDKRSAHGSTPHPPVEARELFLYQDCARFLLIRSLEREIGRSLF